MPPRRKGPASKPASTREALATLDAPESNTAIEAILVGGQGWKRRGKAAPIYGDEHGAYVSMGAPGESLSATEEERAWARVLDLSDLHASALLFVMAKYLAINDNPETARYAQISVNELLEYRGYSRSKKRDFKTSLKIAERDRILALSRIWVTVPTSRRNSKRLTKQSSQLVVVTVDTEAPTGQKMLPHIQLNEPDVPYSFGLILGAWANAYVANQKARAILAGIMLYDPRDSEQRIALRLGLHLHFRPAQVVSVRDILHGARIDIPSHHPERFRDSFEAALDRLSKDGIIGTWAYLRDEDELPRFKWLETWLSWDIAIRPAAVEIIHTPTPASPIQISGSKGRVKKQ